MIHLSENSKLQDGKYKILKVLGQGGFGITYLAEHTLLGKKVAIKEFFYKDYCDRDASTSHITLGTQSNAELVDKFLKKFIKEAQTISQLHHPNIVEIYDIFSENNTAYYVMEFIDGVSLQDLVKQQGKLSENVSLNYIKEVAEALKCVHSHHVNHLDIKPSNIMLRKTDDQIILIDFGTSKQYDVDSNIAPTTTTPVGISAGYAPIEQYRKGGVSAFTPESDIYALGATLYKLLTGITPPESIALEDEGLSNMFFLSSKCQDIIIKCMRIKKSERPHSIEEFETLLNYTPSKQNDDNKEDPETKIIIDTETDDNDIIDNTIEEQKSSIVEDDSQNSNWKKYVAIGVGVAVIAFGVLMFTRNTSNETVSNNSDTTVVEPVMNDELTKPSEVNQDVTPSKEQSSTSSNLSKTETKKDKTKKEESDKEDNAQLLSKSLRNGDYSTVQKLANQGYSPAYVPLAKYYLNNHEYDDANRYAKKAKAAGQSGAQTIITTLTNIGYYD